MLPGQSSHMGHHNAFYMPNPPNTHTHMHTLLPIPTHSFFSWRHMKTFLLSSDRAAMLMPSGTSIALSFICFSMIMPEERERLAQIFYRGLGWSWSCCVKRNRKARRGRTEKEKSRGECQLVSALYPSGWCFPHCCCGNNMWQKDHMERGKHVGYSSAAGSNLPVLIPHSSYLVSSSTHSEHASKMERKSSAVGVCSCQNLTLR